MKQKIITFGGPSRHPASDRQQAAAANSQRRRRRRTGRHTLYYALVLLAALAVLVILSLTVFFRIEKLEITGVTKYAPEELIAESGVKVGDNLFRVSESAVTKRLSDKYPYVESVSFKRSFPATLTLQVKQAQPLGAIDTAMGYVIIGRSGRILESGTDTLPQDLMVVNGMYLSSPAVGRTLGTVVEKGEINYPSDFDLQNLSTASGGTSEQDQKGPTEKELRQQAAEAEKEGFYMLTYLVDAVEETDFDNITLVDFSDRLNMMIVYGDRIIVELGSESDLSYKLKFVKKLIDEQLESNFEGILDASFAATSKEIWRTPCDVQAELEKRQLSQAAKAQEQQVTQAPQTEQSDNPLWEVIPGSASSSEAVGGETENTSSVESSEEEQPLEDDLYAVIPNSSSEPQRSSSGDSQAPAA